MTKDTFTIASIGFDERDQNVLLTVVALAKNRLPSFMLVESSPDKKLADILIVNADKPDAIQRWNAYLKLHQNTATISTLMACEAEPPAHPNDKHTDLKKTPLTHH